MKPSSPAPRDLPVVPTKPWSRACPTSRLGALALAVTVTLAMLVGIDHMAAFEGHAAGWARAAAGTHA